MSDTSSSQLFSQAHAFQESLLSHSLKEHLKSLARFSSHNKLTRSILYKGLKPEIDKVMNGVEYGFYAPSLPLEKRPFYRAVTWNLERGIQFDGILHVLQNHGDIANADLFFLPETDIGMARTLNRNVAGELAKKLGMNYFFAPSYLNLCKGNSIERHYEGDNELALHGNAILSRYPMENLRSLPLKNCIDKMRGKEKRIGCQKVLIADIKFPFQTVTVAAAHLDAHSSQKQRAFQVRTLFESLKDNPYPILLGGDLNTNCYNARHAVYAFFGFWNKVLRGVDHVIDEHYPYPDRYYDRPLFQVLRDYGYSYESLNELGQGTLHYTVDDINRNSLIQDVVPGWCRRIMEETLRRHGGRVSLKLDWFVGKGIQAADPQKGASLPKVIPNLAHSGKALSDHDAILLDFDLYS